MVWKELCVYERLINQRDGAGRVSSGVVHGGIYKVMQSRAAVNNETLSNTSRVNAPQLINITAALCSRRRRWILCTCMNHEGSGECKQEMSCFWSTLQLPRVSRWSFVWKTNVRFEEKTHTVLKSSLQICLMKKKKKKKKKLPGADAETRQQKCPFVIHTFLSDATLCFFRFSGFCFSSVSTLCFYSD